MSSVERKPYYKHQQRQNKQTHHLRLKDSPLEQSGAHRPGPQRHAVPARGRRLDYFLPCVCEQGRWEGRASVSGNFCGPLLSSSTMHRRCSRSNGCHFEPRRHKQPGGAIVGLVLFSSSIRAGPCDAHKLAPGSCRGPPQPTAGPHPRLC